MRYTNFLGFKRKILRHHSIKNFVKQVIQVSVSNKVYVREFSVNKKLKNFKPKLDEALITKLNLREIRPSHSVIHSPIQKVDTGFDKGNKSIHFERFISNKKHILATPAVSSLISMSEEIPRYSNSIVKPSKSFNKRKRSVAKTESNNIFDHLKG